MPDVGLREFAGLVSSEPVPLAAAFLEFASAEYPDLDVKATLRRLDDLAALARPQVDQASGPGGQLLALASFFRQRGFEGNHEDYYDPRNSYLNEVLDRGLGIPISLAVLWIEVGRRVGVELHGIGLPAHFIVGMPDAHLYADPFDPGPPMDREGVMLMFGRVTGARVPWHDDYLRPTPARDIVRRALTNLKAAYLSRGDAARALRACDHLLAVPGHPASELRDRGRLRAARGMYLEAIADLRAYLDAGPDDPADAERELLAIRAKLN